jgi:hypothetical protein
MPYSTWPTQLKMPLDLDGSIMMFNTASFTSTYTFLSTADVSQLQGESPAKIANTVLTPGSGGPTTNFFIVVLFPELRDLTGILVAMTGTLGTPTMSSSPDTTNGLDGTWSTVTITGTSAVLTNTDWWRSTLPATLTNNITGIRGLRILVQLSSGAGQFNILRGLHIFGAKTSGQTADDIQFLNSDGSTVSTKDFDYGDSAAGGAITDTTIYVKNQSGTKTANNVVLSLVGSNPTDFTISTDGGSTFFTSRTLTSLAAGATQAVVVRLTTPSIAGGNATPRAANLRAVVGSWT